MEKQSLQRSCIFMNFTNFRQNVFLLQIQNIHKTAYWNHGCCDVHFLVASIKKYGNLGYFVFLYLIQQWFYFRVTVIIKSVITITGIRSLTEMWITGLQTHDSEYMPHTTLDRKVLETDFCVSLFLTSQHIKYCILYIFHLFFFSTIHKIYN
jgi:hypothetical protein